MKLSTSWEASIRSAIKEIHYILWNPKIYCRVRKTPPFLPILSQMNSVHITHPLFVKFIIILSFYPCLGLPSGFFPSGFAIKTLYDFLLALMSATCPAHLLRDLWAGSEMWTNNSCSHTNYVCLCNCRSRDGPKRTEALLFCLNWDRAERHVCFSVSIISLSFFTSSLLFRL
jgi:hypothetical protein